MRLPKPVRWQGWACYGIQILFIFLFARIYFVTYNGAPGVFAVVVVASIVILYIVTRFKSSYGEMVGVYRPNNIKPAKNFENRYASTEKIKAQSRNKWKKQIRARALFGLGLIIIVQGFIFLFEGNNNVGFTIFILAAIILYISYKIRN